MMMIVDTNCLDITIVDENENDVVISLYHYKENVTFEEIVTALSVGFSSGHWYSRSGYKFIGVKKVNKVIIHQEIEDLL